jgi:hypothetical protein
VNQTTPRGTSRFGGSAILVNAALATGSILLAAVVVALVSRGGFTRRARHFHRQIVTYHKLLTSSRWPAGSYQYDEHAGFKLTPAYSGLMKDKSFYVKTHRLGYRIPEFADNAQVESGGILSVGCSFTFGDRVEAEETFSYLAAGHFRVQSYNYGVCSYSYASVIGQLEELQSSGILEKLKPSILVLGAGDWLVERSLKPCYPTAGLQFGFPYIGKNGDRLELRPASDYYSTKHLYRLVADYAEDGDGKELTPGRYLRLISISPRVSKANLDHRRFVMPTVSSKELCDFVLGRIIGILGKNLDTRMVVLWMPVADTPVDAGLSESVKGLQNVLLVDGLAALRKARVSRDAYYERHPAPEAHAAYAQALIEAISSERESAIAGGGARFRLPVPAPPAAPRDGRSRGPARGAPRAGSRPACRTGRGTTPRARSRGRRRTGRTAG